MNKPIVTCKDLPCEELHPKSVGIVIFGASGDLTSKKLIPSLFNLFVKKLLPNDFYVLGVARSDLSDESFREKFKFILPSHDVKTLNEFLERFFYLSGDYKSLSLYSDLKWRIKALDKKFSTKGNKIFYMAVPPELYLPIAENLGEVGLTYEDSAYSRVIIEKPFGFDLKSAADLDQQLHLILREDQIYRIDHYLGKETVQNILIFRFANSIFEPVWNNHYIDNIQITVAESIGVEHRAGYYEHAGLVRDMFQNHMMQLLSLVAMEPPSSFGADEIHIEKIKLFKSIKIPSSEDIDSCFVRGQYGNGKIDGEDVIDYLHEPGVDPNSKTETFAAAKFLIENWRWSGVPFYLRSGKRLQKRISEIIITFKKVPHSIFPQVPIEKIPSNVLKMNIQPEEGITLSFQAKRPGPKLYMSTLTMNFNYEEDFGSEIPDAYERLLLDCILGDQMLFIRDDVMIESWKIFTPILEKWESESNEKTKSALHIYEAGTWGPKESERLLERDGRCWEEL